MYDFSKIKLDTFWREPQNRYKDQISQAKRNISKSIFKG